ncbi:tetraspanin-11-like [Anopheles arabiensis]|uniref:Tetraspanin n=6 Tax=gambiae species complex TaxID=44542 RepID=Q7QHT0_ANOGA|nr:tetraspanin-11-like [Anopheles arabiensis]XP_040166785.1 tetraspanin-11-like [Anopheles arabiensis]XP_040166786.1 tetraspanin-11-like [Anopheles arabiensis]XP_040236057.1 tetraspanin-11-like [Anopheles coluzzii]XP_040236058.1 tetraspanin-11-like [Anopheles coluzzii]XP_041780786.1 tetraspanin-11-like [Anopheles merus]XP_041780787.1 tetraspanin-11-like [Anopheles merus]XP_061518957.1 tetraspanin-11 [Anopheles gambiae]XP_309308.4 tetraspanin-11 [Anopheles gambiae]EAA05254.4 AGAP011342-PA [
MGSGGRMDCCGQCVKYSMFVANFVIFLGGAIVFSLGIWTLVDKHFINELLGTNLFSGAVYVLIATSALVCLLSFFGCMGAAKEYKCMLLTYFILVFLIFVTMLIGGILGYVFREKVSQTMGDEMRSSMSLYGSRRSITTAWDETQERLKCCGVRSYSDWRGDIPQSCCQRTLDGYKPCIENPSPENIYINGCLEITSSYIRDNAAIIGGAGIGVAVLLIFGMIFSCSLFRMIE